MNAVLLVLFAFSLAGYVLYFLVLLPWRDSSADRTQTESEWREHE